MRTPQEPLVVEEVAPGVTRIALAVPGLSDGVNVHLVRGDGPTTLVDAAMPLPGAFEALERGLETAGTSVAAIEQVVLTHHHMDHVGLTGRIVDDSGAQVVALRPVADVLAAPFRHYLRELRWAEEHAARHDAPDALLDGTRGARAVVEGLAGAATDRVVGDGDVVPAGDLRLTVRHRPGHSPTDTLLVDAQRGVSFVGDHLFRAAPLTPVLGSMLDPDVRPAAAYLRALDETAARDGVAALPGHGPALADPAATIRDRRGALDRRTRRVHEALDDEPTSTWQLGLRVWRGVPSQAHGLTRLAALLASLELLEDDGLAARVGGPEAVAWVRATA